MRIEQIIREYKFDINQMIVLRREGLGLPKLQEFINSAVDFAKAFHEHRLEIEKGLGETNDFLNNPLDYDDLNDRDIREVIPAPKGLTIKEESDEEIQ